MTTTTSSLDLTGRLPLQLTSFIGREREIAQVGALLESSRLLTLTGVGGAGKTRLALEVAARAAPRIDTAWVDLCSLNDPDLVAQMVAGTLGFREEAGRSALDILVERIRERRLLLILDNCEHLVDACATLVESVLRACPEVRILATSREALGVSGEQAWLVPPLSSPETADSESVRLFLERARAVLPSFAIDDLNVAAVAQICRRLDGIPLAIELAAARVRVLAPEQIAARLDDSFKVLASTGRPGAARHRTLKEAIDWSYALLSPPEADLFNQLSAFAGSFSLDAVERVCSAPDSTEVLDLLSALVDKSLVVMETAAGAARYRLLETLRQYGRDKLTTAGGQEAIRRRHADFFVELALSAERPTFGGASDPSWTLKLIVEEGNLRAAADWAEEDRTRAEQAMTLGSALHWHWFARGHFREGARRLNAALEHGSAVAPHPRAKALAASATMAFWLGEDDAILEPATEAVRLLRDLDDPWSLTYALTAQGIGVSITDPLAAEGPLAEAVSISRFDRSVLRVFAIYWQARIAFGRKEVKRALGLFQECLVIARDMGSPPAISHSLTMLGIVETEHGDLVPAAAHLLEALRRHHDVGDVLGTIWALEGLSVLAAKEARFERSTRLLAAVQRERERIGVPWVERERPPFDHLRKDLQDRLGSYLFGTAWSMGNDWSLADAVEHGLCVGEGCEPASPAPPPFAALGTAPARESDTPRTLTTTGELRIPGRLDIQALGPLRVTLNGRVLERDSWNSAKPRELLLFLASHPDGCSREQVGVAFWPEASTAQVRNSFHVTLHRLRKTLGDTHWVQLADDKYTLDPDATVELDALRFERDLPSALQRLKARDSAPLDRVLQLYRGDFLGNETAGDWHFEIRDRLRRRYLDAVTALGEWWIREKDWVQAAEAYRQVIARDELNETAYRSLMSCLAATGDRPEAIHLYQRLEKLLDKELEAEPDEDTKALYAQLRRG